MKDCESTEGACHQYTFFGWATLLVLAAGILIRIIFPESDPHYIHWTGYITDEGRWTEQARNLVLFGRIDTGTWLSLMHLVLGPLFQLLITVSFFLFDVSFFSARLVSIVCGISLLIACYFFLRSRLTQDALFVSVLVLAFQTDLVFLSRVAIPEMSAMLFELLAFIALVTKPYSSTKVVIIGLLMIAAAGMKATVAPIMPIFIIIFLLLQKGENAATVVPRTFILLGVLVAPAVILLAGAAFWGGMPLLERLWTSFQGLEHFLSPSSTYSIITFLFYGDIAATINLFLLILWLVAGLLIAFGQLPETRASMIYACSIIWICGWIAVSAFLEYFPSRYVYHVLIPIILNLGAGITILRIIGRRDIGIKLMDMQGLRRIFCVAWLSMPISVLLCPLFISMLDLADITIDRFREQLTLLILVTLIMTLILYKYWRAINHMCALVIFPLIVSLLWFAGVELEIIGDTFWKIGTESSLFLWPSTLILAALLTVAVYSVRERRQVLRGFGAVYILAFVCLWLSQYLPGMVRPGYAISGMSAGLAEFADAESVFGAGGASSLFLKNRLRYTEKIDIDNLPEMLVVAFDKIDPKILDHYTVIHEQEIHFVSKTIPETTIRIYERKN